MTELDSRPSECWICLDDGQIVERFVNRQDHDAALQRRNAGAAIQAYLATRREQGRVEVRVDDDVVANSIVAAAVKAEREACALIAETVRLAHPEPAFNRGYNDAAGVIAAAIRSRSSISTKGENA